MKYQKSILISFFIFLTVYVYGETLFVGEDECKNVIFRNKLIEKKAERIWKIYDADNTPLDMPTKIEKDKDKLFVLCIPTSINVYDINGKYLRGYNEKGKGPGEFMSIKDISIDNGYLYCLDDDKRCIMKFTEDFTLLWEKKIPENISNIYPQNIEVNNNFIYISGFVTSLSKNKGTYLVYKLDENMKILDRYFKLVDSFYKKVSIFKRKKKFLENMFKTSNVISVKDSIIVMGIMAGENILYGFNMKNKSFIFKVVDKNTKGKYKIKKRLVGFSLESAYSIIDIKLTKNYIITSESAGDLSYYKDNDLHKHNHLSLYSKNGKYLFSIFTKRPDLKNNKHLVYYTDYGGFGMCMEEKKEGLIIYQTIQMWNQLFKLKIGKVK